MRINTRFTPDDVALPTDMPSVRGVPFTFVARLVAAKIGMLLGR
jgi:hypothetical protein